MLLLFGIIKKIFKIHTQERKVATYTSTSLKSRFCLFVTMAHGINCTQFLGKPKLRMAKKAYQDGHTQVRRTLNRARGHATQTCSLWRVSSHSSKTERSQTFPAMKRKESTQRHVLNHHPIPPLPSQLAEPSLPQQHRGHAVFADCMARGWEAALLCTCDCFTQEPFPSTEWAK